MENQPERLFSSNIDIESYSQLFLLSYLTCPEDGQPYNFKVQITSHQKTRLLGIDMGQSFFSSHYQEGRSAQVLSVKTMIYLLASITQLLDEKLISRLKLIDTEQWFKYWQVQLENLNRLFYPLLEEATAKNSKKPFKKLNFLNCSSIEKQELIQLLELMTAVESLQVNDYDIASKILSHRYNYSGFLINVQYDILCPKLKLIEIHRTREKIIQLKINSDGEARKNLALFIEEERNQCQRIVQPVSQVEALIYEKWYLQHAAATALNELYSPEARINRLRPWLVMHDRSQKSIDDKTLRYSVPLVCKNWRRLHQQFWREQTERRQQLLLGSPTVTDAPAEKEEDSEHQTFSRFLK